MSYQIEEYRESYLSISFTNTQIEYLNKIKLDLDNLLSVLVQNKSEFDMKRMLNLIKMKISEINDKVIEI